MSYQVLARKWRPKNFREMVGQEHVLKALINALDHDRLHHAYLFTGTRGVGKTTIARILAKCLNCERGVSSEPCGECSSCVEIAEGRSVDLLEVDAASRTKVEDTRELLDNVQYAPTRSRYKVYLIDEVHMLSTHSFNALLKTLEEPPPHVKFLLATTDPQKLPATVLSRCLQFNLKNMPPEQIVGHLSHVLGQEMVSFEEPALWLLGRAAAGSMRDALSLTDQAIAFGSGQLNEADVRTMLGTVDLTFVIQLLETLAAGDAVALLDLIARMAQHAPDFEAGLDELISLVHRVAVAQVVPGAVDNHWGDADRVAAIGQSISAEDAQLFYQVALNGKRDLPLAADPRSGFEMLLLRMLAFRPAAVVDPGIDPDSLRLIPSPNTPQVASGGDNLVKKSLRAPDITASESTAQAAPASAVPAQAVPASAVPASAVPAQAAPISEDLTALDNGQWPLVLKKLSLAGMVSSIASNCEFLRRDATDLYFLLDENNASLFNDSHVETISRALKNFFGCELSVNIVKGVPGGETPAMQHARLVRERQAEAVKEIEGDTQLQQLIDQFDGELDRASIVPLDV